MEAKEVIARLCELQARVGDHVGWEYAADCFCGKYGLWGIGGYDGTKANGYRNDGKALEFIEQAVKEKIERESAKQ